MFAELFVGWVGFGGRSCHGGIQRTATLGHDVLEVATVHRAQCVGDSLQRVAKNLVVVEAAVDDDLEFISNTV